ncbi:Aste57867_21835 [Aphanomyces stellatus]|uniref:Aste57867_21835 protein n=1 Tax=Aphanomyces stellatus TaxID=120398 RepID=A0A485LJW7_9STRA|nr:hypothetical protein As57867_021766 [Aphanomyces stellatus]VFT98504.1 Aste57867_21835 [Aphanomyces stellatus]
MMATPAGEAADAIRNVLSFCCGTDNTKVYLQDLLRVFDVSMHKRTLDDDLREILQVTHPKARHLNGWHLERLALGEFGDQTPQDIQRKIHGIKKDIRSSKALVTAMLEREQMWNEKREAFVSDKRKQQEAMTAELSFAKEIVQKMHVVDESNSAEEAMATILAMPAPVEARLLSASEASNEIATLDLSDAAPI